MVSLSRSSSRITSPMRSRTGSRRSLGAASTGLALDLNLYWFGAQHNHIFSPQWDRVAAIQVQLCDTVFRSGYLAYPDWVPAIDVFGVPFDASQMFVGVECGGVGTEETSWGAIKGLHC